jgi:putative membrane protein
MSEKSASVPEEKRATEYLANERTFLAWVRTSIALIGIGAALAKLSPILHPQRRFAIESSLAAGVAMMVFGAILAVLAAWRYHVVNRQIERGQVTADRGLILLVTLLVVVLAAALCVYMLLTDQQP